MPYVLFSFDKKYVAIFYSQSPLKTLKKFQKSTKYVAKNLKQKFTAESSVNYLPHNSLLHDPALGM